MLLRQILYIIVFSVSLFFITKANAEILKKLIVKGNGKTEVAYIMRNGGFRIGDDVSPQMLTEIEERLRRINQINIEWVEFTDGILTIHMRDKWTLFPIPMITQSGTYYSRGMLLYDNNFLGTLGTFAPAVAWTNSGFNGLLYFQDETFFTSSSGFKILLLRKSDLSEFERKGDVVTSFESRYDTMTVVPNLLWGKHVIKAGPLYYNKKIESQKIVLNSEDEGIGLIFRHHYNDYQKLEVLFKGLETTYNLIVHEGKDGENKFLNEFDFYWSFPLFKRDFLNLKIHGVYVNSKDILDVKVTGGHEGYRGYDKQSIPVGKNIGGMIQYQRNIWDNLYLTPFYEFNAIQLANNIGPVNNLNENTVGLSIYYYFKRISIPAVMVDYARNIDDKSTHLLLNIGVSI